MTLEERQYIELTMGLPPGVTIGDILKDQENEQMLRQAYLLTQQVNEIEANLARFDRARVPSACRQSVEAQIQKLTSVRAILWNALISLATRGMVMDEQTLTSLLEKQADDVVALGEMEKIATAIKMDQTGVWAKDIESSIVGCAAEKTLEPPVIVEPRRLISPVPLYDEPEGLARPTPCPIVAPERPGVSLSAAIPLYDEPEGKGRSAVSETCVVKLPPPVQLYDDAESSKGRRERETREMVPLLI